MFLPTESPSAIFVVVQRRQLHWHENISTNYGGDNELVYAYNEGPSNDEAYYEPVSTKEDQHEQTESPPATPGRDVESANDDEEKQYVMHVQIQGLHRSFQLVY